MPAPTGPGRAWNTFTCMTVRPTPRSASNSIGRAWSAAAASPKPCIWAPGTDKTDMNSGAGAFACHWSFYILLVTFMGISPGGARESSPWREPWEQTRTARSPGGAKEPFHGDSPIAGHEGPSYAPTGLARLWAGPTGLTPWAIF